MGLLLMDSDDNGVEGVTAMSEPKDTTRFEFVKDQWAGSRVQRRLTDRFWNTWKPELVALLFSVTCTIAMSIILSSYDGKATPNIPGGLTLNAIVSILATSSKTALIFSLSNSLGQLKWVWLNGDSSKSLVDAEVFDDASRGPLGAVVMLYSHATRSFASFGSLLILLALAFDPFVQQVVRYENRVSYTPSALALLPRARFLASNGYNFDTAKSLNAAFWRDEFIPTASCPTTDCSWPMTRSISFVGECHVDDTWTLNDDCNLSFTLENLNETSKGISHTLRTCNATSRDGGEVITGLQFDGKDPDQNGSSTWKTITIPRYIVAPLPALFEEVSKCDNYRERKCGPALKPFYQYSILDWRNGSDLETEMKLSLVATRCTLDLYLSEFSSSVVGGQLVTNVTRKEAMKKSSQHLDNHNGAYMCFDSPFETPQNFSALAQEFEWQDLNFIYDSTAATSGFCLNHLDILTQVDGSGSLKWWTTTMDQVMTVNINATQTSRMGWRWSNSTFLISRDEMHGLFYSGNVRNVSTNDQVWQESSPTKIAENLANSLTKLLRDPGLNRGLHYGLTYNGTDTISGSAGNVVAYAKIRWVWLILPYILSVGGMVFLLHTMWVSKRSKAPLWKSSINALIFHGIDHDYDITSKLTTLTEMDRQASMTQVRLAPLSEMNDRLVLRTSVVRIRSNSA